MEAKRLNNIIYIRFIATNMVIAYHSLCLYTSRWNYTDSPPIALYEHLAEIFNRIDMPAFVFISGYLLSKQITNNKYSNCTDIFLYKIKRLFIPYIFWLVINLLLIPETLSFSDFFYGINHLWFLPMLLHLSIFSIISLPIWTKFSKRTSLICFASMLFIFFIAYYKGWNLPIAYIKTFLPVFYLGIITEKHHLLNINKRNLKYILFISIVIYVLVCLFLFTPNPSIRDLIIKLSAFSIIFSSMGILKSDKEISNRIILLVDKYSMGIYLIHHIIIQYLLSFNSIVQTLNIHHIMGPILIFAISLLTSIFLASQISKVPYLRYVI